MFSIKGNSISLTRGDTLFLTVALIDPDGSEYEVQEGDTLRFAMKKRIKSEECLILKSIPTDTLTLEIEPQDTKPLEFGDYVYDIEFTDAAGHVSTILLGTFSITEEVY